MKTLNKLIVIIFLFSVIISLNLTTDINAQEIDSTETEVIINKMRLPISPSKDTKTTYHSLEDEVAILIFDALEELRLYDIIVGINIDSTLEIQDSTITDDMILNIKDIDDFTEAIVITGIDFYQTGVPPKKEEDYFSINGPMQGLFDNNSEKATRHIQITFKQN